MDSNELSCFSYDAREELFNYYEELEQDIGEEIDFDPVAIRCEWSEYTDLSNVAESYIYMHDDCETDEERREWLNDHTRFIEFEGGVLVLDF